MDPTIALVLPILVPIADWAGAILVLRGRYQGVQRNWMSRGQTPPFVRVLISSVYGAFPVLIGGMMWFMASRLADDLRGIPAQWALDADNLLLWMAIAYAVAASCAIAGQTLVIRGRLSSYLGSDFRHVLPISVVPMTDVVFAFVLGFLAFGYVDYATHGGIPASGSAIASAISSLQAFTVASLAVPVAALASNRIRDLGARGFSRALAVMELGELPIVIGLILGLLAFNSLTTP